MAPTLMLLITLVGSAALTAAGVMLLLNTRLGSLFLDPTNKSNAMHAVPVPRIGGLPIAIVVVVIFVFASGGGLTALPKIVGAGVGLALFSLIDDRRGLPAWVRLIAHFVAAAFVLSAVAEPLSALNLAVSIGVAYGLLCLAIVWTTNLFNFMDGANGLAGLMGFVGFGALAVACVSNGNSSHNDLALLCVSISGACAGFLFFNLPRGLIFLGDVGSIFLGFMTAAVGIYGALAGAWPLWIPALCFSPFIVDATVTLCRRALRGERIWQPHRQHFYHRLILDGGWSHTRTAVIYGVLMAAASGHAVLWLHSSGIADDPFAAPPVLSIFLPWVLTYVTLLSVAEWHLRRQPLRKTNMSAKDTRGAK